MCSAAPRSRKRCFRASSSRSARTSCRCCGPEIIRDLDLPRHGLEILPLDGTFTPMPNGDYLWRVNDHAQTQREISAALEARRRSLRRVRQGDGRDGAVRQADPQHDAARSDVAESTRADEAAVSRQPLPRPRGRRSLQPAPADDDERGRFPRSVVRDRRAQGDDVGIGDHRDVSRRAIAGDGVCAAAPLHGRNRRRVSLVGIRPRRHRRDFERDRGGGARSGRRDPDRGAGGAHFGARRAGHRRRDDERRRVRGRPRAVERRSAPDVPAGSSTRRSCRRTSSRKSGATSSAARPAR